MLEMQLTGRKLTPIAKVTRWMGFNFSTWLNTGKLPLTVPATSKKLAMGTPALPGYSYMSNANFWEADVATQNAAGKTFTLEMWAKCIDAGTPIIAAITQANGTYVLILVGPSDTTTPGKTYGKWLVGQTWMVFDADVVEAGNNQWAHYAITYEAQGENVKVCTYINGTLRKIKPMGDATAFTTDFALIPAIQLGDVWQSLAVPNGSNSPVTEFVIWEGIPGHIGKGKPTTGPIRDTTQSQGQVEVTGNTLIWTVPDGVTSLNVFGYGGGGGGSSKYRGGAGYSYGIANLPVTPGEQLVFNPGSGGSGASSATTSGSPGGNSTIVRKGAVIFTALGADGGTLSSIGAGGPNSTPTLKPGGATIAQAGTTGTSRGYSGGGGGIRALWGEGRGGVVSDTPDV